MISSIPPSKNHPAAAKIFRLGVESQAEADILRLDQLVAPAVSFDAWVRPLPRLTIAEVLSYRSAWGRYGLHLDPIGSVAFVPGKPRQWVMVQKFVAFPAEEFTFEAVLCPYRANSCSTIFSYSCVHTSTTCDVLLQDKGTEGLVLSINGKKIVTGLHLDFHQWQHIALTWRSTDGRVCLYKEDGVAAIAALAEGRTIDFGPPVFVGSLAAGEHIADGGSLVIGQEQGTPGVLSDFVPDAGFVGGLRMVRLWSRAHDLNTLNHHKSGWLSGDEPGLIGCWYFTRRALEIGECLNACSSTDNIGLIGGLTVASLCDIQLYRLLIIAADQTVASRVPLTAQRWQHVAVTCRGQMAGLPVDSSLEIDGIPVPVRPLTAADAPPPQPPHFRIGPMANSLMAELRLRQADNGDLLAHYTGDLTPDGRLRDQSGRGFDLSVTGEFKLEPRD